MSLTDTYTPATTQAEIAPSKEEQEDKYPTNFLDLARQAEQQARTYSTSSVRNKWSRSYRAFHNEHFIGSKYSKTPYRGRTKLFKPKTRSAVRKNEAAASQALFSTLQTVSIKAVRENDLMATVSAEVLHEIINYRFDRSSGRNGIPWFLVAMGARQDSQITSMCFSKQYWQYETEPTKQDKKESEQNLNVAQPSGDYSQDPLLNKPVNEDGLVDYPPDSGDLNDPPETKPPEPESRPRYDRPMTINVAPENVTVDPSAPWWDPVQEGGYIRVAWPMPLHEVRGMMQRGSGVMGGGRWFYYNDSVIRQSYAKWDARTIRQSREFGRDRMSEEAANTGDLQIVWIYENFFRWEGIDYHFWSLGEDNYLTAPTPTKDVYPAHQGSRPYVGGYGVIESHSVWPMSPVESWQQMQMEANDLTNLRLDVIKQNIAPLTKVKKGSQTDWKSLRNRGPDSTILVHDMDDIDFDRPTDIGASAYQEMNHLNADFDDLAGNFSSGSVMTNRSLHETVGGMKMLSGSANTMTEYDLRVWVETWVEPVIRQIVQLEQYYEDNEEILSIAGERAQIWRKYQVDQVTSDMLDYETLVSIDVGIGANDPQAQQQKLAMAFATLGEVAPFADRPVKVNMEQTARAVFGYAGYKDGMKFIELGEPGQPEQPSEEEIKAQQEAQKAQMEAEERMAEAQMQQQTDMAKIESDRQTAMLQIESSERLAAEGNATTLEKTRQQGRIQLLLAAFEGQLSQIERREERQAERLSSNKVEPKKAA